MESVPEYEARGARPKRHARPPGRYADYEMEYPGYVSQAHREDVELTHQEDKARMTSLTSPFSYNLASPQWRRDVNLHETASCYGAQSQQHIQENRLAPQLYPERSRGEQAYDHSTPLPFVLPYTHPNKQISAELEDIRQERHLIQQTQQRMSSDLVELKALRAEMRQLVEAVQTMQGPSSLQTSKLMQSPLPGDAPEIEEDDDWPAPPPWPDPVEEAPLPSNPPVLNPHHKDAGVFPAIKTEAMAIPPTNRFVDHPGQSLSPDPPPALRFPDNASHSPPPWFKPVPPRSGNFPLGGSKHPRVTYGDSKTEHDCNPASPEQQFNLSSTQPLPDRPNLGRTSIASETVYHGPRPTIPNFSSRDPSEFARLKMALGNLLPEDATELFKYQVLVDHLHLEEARLIADAYLNSSTPFTDTMEALNDKFGQPHQIVLRRIAAMMDSPDIRRGDVLAFERFALQIQSLVGMLRTLGPEEEVELHCGSHVTRLLSKLPPEQRAEFRHCMFQQGVRMHTLADLAGWLKYESWCQDSEGQLAAKVTKEKQWPRPEVRQGKRSITVLRGAKEVTTKPQAVRPGGVAMVVSGDSKAATDVLYLDRPTEGCRVLRKIIKVCIHYGKRTISTYAVLDDGSERTMLLPEAAEKLGMQGIPEDVPLRMMCRRSEVSQCRSLFPLPQGPGPGSRLLGPSLLHASDLQATLIPWSNSEKGINT
ncbi:unnamed protein product [Oreochromis niloticus]|nr:unnamed protein product [Mustela putorius furo]